MTEQKLRALLENTLTEHSYRCLHNPEFTVTGGMEEEMSLLMTCPVSQVSGSCLTPPFCLGPFLDCKGSHKSSDPGGCVAVIVSPPPTFLGSGFTSDHQ